MTVELDQSNVITMTRLLRKAQHVAILTHVAPDGDAMGSSLAMYLWVKEVLFGSEQSRSVELIVPNAFPVFFQWMPGAEHIHIYEKEPQACDAILAQADLFICTDFNDPKRINTVGERMMANESPKIMIDHHLDPTDFAQISFSFPAACSACEVVYRVMEAISIQDSVFRIQQEVATCIYTGLMTDTGNFSFNSSRYEIYEIIANLMRAGVNKDAIYDAVFNQYSVDKLRLTGYALHRKMRIYPEYHLSLITLSADELERYHYQQGDTEGLVNMPLQIADVYYSVYMREERPKPGTPKPRIRLSFRSQGDRPVNIWANEVFHGGGHMNAAGGELLGTLQQAVRLFEQTFPKFVKKD